MNSNASILRAQRKIHSNKYDQIQTMIFYYFFFNKMLSPICSNLYSGVSSCVVPTNDECNGNSNGFATILVIIKNPK